MATRAPKSVAQPRPVTMARAVGAANRWRDTLNPVRGLTMRRAASLIESYARGEFADLMWTFGAPFSGIESSDPTLAAIMELRLSALLEMDWQIKQVAPEKNDQQVILWPRGFDAVLADEQQAALREAYEGIDNLYEAIEHFGIATFRGFAHIEKWENADGDLYHLEPVDQWNVVRDGSRGAWKYNPEARTTSFASLPADLLIDPASFLIREVKRPVGRIALTKWVREGLSQKDWDAFIEIYGIPGGIVIMPPNVPKGQESEYEASAADCAKGGSGALPNGSKYAPNDQPRGNNPFKEHLEWLQRQLVLAGTGGMLTMLAESGSGTLAGAAHMETFQRIARGEGRRIAELFQRGVDASILEQNFPGKPALAWFDLCISEETDASKFVGDVEKLSSAGYEVSAEQIEEKTGYQVKLKPAPAAPALPGERMLLNRARSNAAAEYDLEDFLDRAEQLVGTANDRDLQPLRAALAKLLDGPNESFAARLEEFRDTLTKQTPELLKAPASIEAYRALLGSALVTGLATRS